MWEFLDTMLQKDGIKSKTKNIPPFLNEYSREYPENMGRGSFNQRREERKMVDLVNKIIAWEGGEMEEDEEVEFFQELIDNGMAWTLQGCYGRNAKALIEAGLCHSKMV